MDAGGGGEPPHRRPAGHRVGGCRCLYGLLVDLDHASAFCDAVAAQAGLRIAYIVTDDDRRFQAVARSLPDSVEPVRFYESYLSNFRFSMGR